MAELIGAHLDYWVCKAEGLDVIVAMRENCGDTEPSCLEVNGRGIPRLCHSPSASWSQGGPIIDRVQFGIFERVEGGWGAGIYRPQAGMRDLCIAYQTGDTVLIAAMRAYVESKFGHEVPDEGC
ncbi:phage protein NinX family protein [Burkholderia gladioli]|uniref:phage protein NinX family protein n=1 Tax=Burkholderia gladioli TaxID=28095 RepID=UPI00163FF0D5|nr:phage protein NinX family protein [Burkholderia gladioli]